MREFFHGWRRKAGCITLVMVCSLMGLWTRCLATRDSIGIVVGGGMYFVSSTDFGFECRRDFDPPPVDGPPIWWNFIPPKPTQPLIFTYGDAEKIEPVRTVLHWPIVLPLGVLSVYLILWKPRKRTRKDDVT